MNLEANKVNLLKKCNTKKTLCQEKKVINKKFINKLRNLKNPYQDKSYNLSPEVIEYNTGEFKAFLKNAKSIFSK